jgi:chromosome segregation ATPase
MNEKKKRYQKKLDFQQKMIARQSDKIESLTSQIEALKLECERKDEIINSVTPLKEELTKNVNEIKKYKKEYRTLIEEARKMKNIINQEVYKNRWWLIKLLIK